ACLRSARSCYSVPVTDTVRRSHCAAARSASSARRCSPRCTSADRDFPLFFSRGGHMNAERVWIPGVAVAVLAVAANAAADRHGVQDPTLPASGATANDRLAASPRHGEWVVVRTGADSVRAWVVYPERRENAPV